MAELLARPVEVTRIYTLPAGKAMALEDPLRALMLNLMSEKPRSVEELAAEVRVRGYRKAVTTIRHHLDVLKRAGLVELARAEESRGAVLKYFASKARVLGYELGPEAEEQLAPAVRDAEKALERVLRDLHRRHGREIRRVAEGLKDCPYCPTPHFTEYVTLRVLERATVGAARRIRWQKG